MDRQTMFKFLFVLIVGILIVGMSIYSFFGEKDNEEYDDIFDNEMIEDTDESIDNDLLEELKKDLEDEKKVSDDVEVDGNEIDNETNTDKDFSIEDHEIYETTIDEFDYKQKYMKQFGEQVVKQTLTTTDELIKMYINKSQDWDSWSDHVTPALLSELKKSVSKANNKKANKIDSLEIFPTEQVNKDEIVIGCIAHYDGKTELVNIIFIEEGDKFLADKIVPMWSR